MPWAGNIVKTMTSNGKQFTVYPRNVDRCCKSFANKVIICFHQSGPFVLLYNKSLNDWSLGEQWILFPENLNVSLDFVSGNIAVLGKQNPLFLSGPVIKCKLLLLTKFQASSIKPELSSICELLYTSKAFRNYFLITCSGTRHSNFSLVNIFWRETTKVKRWNPTFFRETFVYEVILYLLTNVERRSFTPLRSL